MKWLNGACTTNWWQTPGSIIGSLFSGHVSSSCVVKHFLNCDFIWLTEHVCVLFSCTNISAVPSSGHGAPVQETL